MNKHPGFDSPAGYKKKKSPTPPRGGKGKKRLINLKQWKDNSKTGQNRLSGMPNKEAGSHSQKKTKSRWTMQ